MKIYIGTEIFHKYITWKISGCFSKLVWLFGLGNGEATLLLCIRLDMTCVAVSRLRQDMLLMGLENIARFNLGYAVSVTLGLLYKGMPISLKVPTKNSRNNEILARYATGERIPELAKVFGVSNARIHQILHGKRK